MVYRLLGWGVVGRAYHKIQIVSCASANITINNGISIASGRLHPPDPLLQRSAIEKAPLNNP